MRKNLLGGMLILFILMIFTVPAFANVSKYITQLDGIAYEYDYEQLKKSYTNSVLGLGGTELFQDYQQAGILFAMYDDEKGYVDYENIRDAYTQAILTGSAFELNNYVSTCGIEATMPEEVTVVSIVNGKISKTTKAVEGTVGVKNFQTASSLEMGKILVIVELDSLTPENYDVFVKDTKLNYNEAAGKFTGDVPEADALRSNVRVEAKTDKGFCVVKIY